MQDVKTRDTCGGHCAVKFQEILKGVLEILGQTSGMSSPNRNKKKTFVKIYIPETLAFRSTAQQSVELGALRFYLWGTITNPSEFNSNSKLRDASARQL